MTFTIGFITTLKAIIKVSFISNLLRSFIISKYKCLKAFSVYWEGVGVRSHICEYEEVH